MELPKPQSRSEKYLNKIATGEGELPLEPKSRVEKYLNKIATGEGELPLEPLSRIEKYLSYICQNGGIGGGAGSPGAGSPKELYLYNKGDEFSDITGGWQAKQFNATYPNGHAEKGETYLEFGEINKSGISSGYMYGTGGFITNNWIDLTNYTEMVVDWETINTAGINATLDIRVDSGEGPISICSIGKTVQKHYSVIDISNLKGIHLIAVTGDSGAYDLDQVLGRLYTLFLR